MTGVVKAAFRASHVDDFEPIAVVDRVSEGIRDFDAGRFVTLCCARVRPRQRELTYVNAGHPEPIVRTALDSTISARLHRPVPDVGPVRHPLRAGDVEFGPGDSLLFYTDGVTEASGASGMFGTDRLVAAVMSGDRRGAALLDEILAQVAAFTGSSHYQDDVTLLTLDLARE